MTVLPDVWIRDMARKHGMIEPFAENRPRKGKLSYGAASYGYDLRLADEFEVPEFPNGYLDPKRMDAVRFRSCRGSTCLIPANSFVLGRSLEYIRVPRNTLVICQGKSTYARCGLVVNVTPFEPEWEGYVTISLVNCASVPLKVYANEGIAQIVFLRAESECRTSYADRRGKYQAQMGIQRART